MKLEFLPKINEHLKFMLRSANSVIERLTFVSTLFLPRLHVHQPPPPPLQKLYLGNYSAVPVENTNDSKSTTDTRTICRYSRRIPAFQK